MQFQNDEHDNEVNNLMKALDEARKKIESMKASRALEAAVTAPLEAAVTAPVAEVPAEARPKRAASRRVCK